MQKSNQKRAPKGEEGTGLPAAQECIICAYPIDDKERLRTLTTCDHTEPICSICYLRIRALQRNFHCPTCKREIDNVICVPTEEAKVRHFNDYQIWNNNTIDETFVYEPKGQIFFPKEYYQQKIKKIWLYQCPLCQQTRRDFKQLRGHMINEHNMHMCNLCGEFKQVFPAEHKMYTQQHYDQHLRKGDNDGSNGHPLCEFCRKRFYDSTALFLHLTKDHFTCHLCEQLGIKFKYFAGYPDLEEHFKHSHFLCDDPVCLDKRFIVFKNEIDLFAHRKSYHPHLMLEGRASIPLHFQYRKQDPNATVFNATGERVFQAEEKESSTETTAPQTSGNSEIIRKDRFEGGLGGRAIHGEWQVELQPTTSDPRDPNRNLHRDEVVVAQSNQQDEEFPELMPSSVNPTSGQLINRWISIKDSSGGNQQGKGGVGKGSYSGSAQGVAKKNKAQEFPSLPGKPAAPVPVASAKLTANKLAAKKPVPVATGSDLNKMMNYVTSLADEEVIPGSVRPPNVVDSLGNWASVKVDKRLQKKKVGSNNKQPQRGGQSAVDDFDEEDYPTLGGGGGAGGRGGDSSTWNSTGIVYSQDEFSSELEKALHDSLEEFNEQQFKKSSQESLKDALKEENYPSLGGGKAESPIPNEGPKSSRQPQAVNKPKKSDDWSAAMKSIGLNAPKRPTKSAGITVVKHDNVKGANKKLTSGLSGRKEEANSTWKSREDETSKPSPPPVSVAVPARVSPPPAPVIQQQQQQPLKEKKYGGWEKRAGAYEEEQPQQLEIEPSPRVFENNDFPTLGGGRKKN